MNASDWSEITRRLADVAMGRRPADLIVNNGTWVCVQSGEILEGFDIAVSGDRIAFVGEDASHTLGDETTMVDAKGRYMVPGLLDGHMHIESGMVTITEFARAVIPHGTTGMFVDPHEIANVFGLEGVRMMVDEAGKQPIHVWVQMPSCVPSAPGLETAGAIIGPAEAAEAMTWPGIIGLGEVMNFPGVFNADEKLHEEMAETRMAGKVIGGHYASLDLGLPFHAYAAAGPEDDHEGTRKEDAIARVRQGMKAMLRLGSAWYDVADQIRAITEEGLDPRHFILVTDDSHSGTLVHDGHMNRVVRHAIEQGVTPLVAIQMATLNTAEHFGVAGEVGQIAPGRYADILIVPDLEEFKIDLVIAQGKLAARNGELLLDVRSFRYPEKVRESVKLARALTAADFVVPTELKERAEVHVIGVVENQAPTRHLRKELPVLDGQIRLPSEGDIAKVALVERHRGTGQVQVGFVEGFRLSAPCAMASTVAHDSHHMLVVGTDEESMAAAANELARVGGGQIVVRHGETLACVELPIAGLMSDERAEVVAEKAQAVLKAMRICGCDLNNANMQLSLLALVVIPELRISDQGLVDVERFERIPVVVDGEES